MIRIKLEKRSAKSQNVVLPGAEAARLIDSGDAGKDILWNKLKKFVETGKGFIIHDSQWLRDIVNGIENPNKPPKLTEFMKWASLAQSVGALTTDDTELQINDIEARLIWDRINSDWFSYSGNPIDYLPFNSRLFEVLQKAINQGS